MIYQLKNLINLFFYKTKYEAHLDNFNVYWKKKIKNAIQALEKAEKPKEVIDAMYKFLKEEKEKDRIKTEKNIAHYKRRIKIFTPFATREIVDIYDSDYDAGTKIILFTGEEQGAYWFKGDGCNE